MRIKVIIENGETDIILTPENVFEKDILEKIYDKKQNFNFHTEVDAKYNMAGYEDHKIRINITETK